MLPQGYRYLSKLLVYYPLDLCFMVGWLDYVDSTSFGGASILPSIMDALAYIP